MIDRLLFLAAGTPILVLAALVATRVPGVPRSYEIAALVTDGAVEAGLPPEYRVKLNAIVANARKATG